MHERASLVAKPLRWKAMTHISSLLLFVCIVPYSQFVFPSFYLHRFPWKFGKLLQQFETREFCVILTWTLKIKVKSESHCLGETGAFCPAQTHSTRAKAQQGWAPTHFLGKQHVYFTGISSALPISAPHTMCSKHTASAIQNIQTFIGHPHLGKPNGVFSLLVNNNNTIIAWSSLVNLLHCIKGLLWLDTSSAPVPVSLFSRE